MGENFVTILFMSIILIFLWVLSIGILSSISSTGNESNTQYEKFLSRRKKWPTLKQIKMPGRNFHPHRHWKKLETFEMPLLTTAFEAHNRLYTISITLATLSTIGMTIGVAGLLQAYGGMHILLATYLVIGTFFLSSASIPATSATYAKRWTKRAPTTWKMLISGRIVGLTLRANLRNDRPLKYGRIRPELLDVCEAHLTTRYPQAPEGSWSAKQRRLDWLNQLAPHLNAKRTIGSKPIPEDNAQDVIRWLDKTAKLLQEKPKNGNHARQLSDAELAQIPSRSPEFPSKMFAWMLVALGVMLFVIVLIGQWLLDGNDPSGLWGTIGQIIASVVTLVPLGVAILSYLSYRRQKQAAI
ncbi:hypothetical protein [Arthrobacter russicus]|uniref:Uncharacterized protein n=2 Tax=Bacillati TaxID=1783272 RepID=A0ABU1JBW9_9MICC|nr:hypothetical protein [Arthrobacter russicus]MDR6269917.1 hypothetical protein [Arthrobacter russicus]